MDKTEDDPIFFPKKGRKNNPLQEQSENIVKKELEKMESLLEMHNEIVENRDSLKDQLTWLRKQVDHFSRVQDQSRLTKDFDWVADNFNHALNLNNENRFNGLGTLLDQSFE